MNDIETAKEYMEEIGVYAIRIQSIETEIALIRCTMGDIDAIKYESIGSSSNYNTKSPQEVRINRLLNYEKELEDLKRELDNIRRDRVNVILSLDDKDEIRVLYERYVLLRSWEKIIDESGYGKSSVLSFHRRGLINVAKNINHGV